MMPRFRKKPVVIEAIQLQPEVVVPEGVKLRHSVEDGETVTEVYNELHDSWIKLRNGDWLRTDRAPRDVYPIAGGIFEATYEPDDQYIRGTLVIDPEVVGDFRAAFDVGVQQLFERMEEQWNARQERGE